LGDGKKAEGETFTGRRAEKDKLEREEMTQVAIREG
jgi:hypothetical protein